MCRRGVAKNSKIPAFNRRGRQSPSHTTTTSLHSITNSNVCASVEISDALKSSPAKKERPNSNNRVSRVSFGGRRSLCEGRRPTFSKGGNFTALFFATRLIKQVIIKHEHDCNTVHNKKPFDEKKSTINSSKREKKGVSCASNYIINK